MRADLGALLKHDHRDLVPLIDASCFNLIAAASPAGPAPTMTTSNSIASRSTVSVSAVSLKAQAPIVVGWAKACMRRAHHFGFAWATDKPLPTLRVEQSLLSFGEPSDTHQ